MSAIATASYNPVFEFAAANDPHWRVRYALAQLLEERGRDPEAREAILQALPDPAKPSLRGYMLRNVVTPASGEPRAG